MKQLLALALLLSSSAGCAVIMNGEATNVTARSATPGARIYVDGFDATTAGLRVSNDRPHVVMVRARGYADKTITLVPTVKILPIILDAILTVPTLALVLSLDVQAGWWTSIDVPRESIDLVRPTGQARPRPVYFIGDKEVPSVAGAAGGVNQVRARRTVTANDAIRKK